MREWVRARGDAARASIAAWRRPAAAALPNGGGASAFSGGDADASPLEVVTGFIEEDAEGEDGGAQIMAGVYELHVRLGHLLERWEGMRKATADCDRLPFKQLIRV